MTALNQLAALWAELAETHERAGNAQLADAYRYATTVALSARETPENRAAIEKAVQQARQNLARLYNNHTGEGAF